MFWWVADCVPTSPTVEVRTLVIWLLGDGCCTYGLAYGVWVETQQWGEVGHGGGSSARHSAQQADWGTAARSNLLDKSDCWALARGGMARFTYWVSPRIAILESKGSQMVALRPGERLAAGDVASWDLSWVHFTPRDAQEPRDGLASVNTQLDLNAHREEHWVSSWRIFLQTESVIVLMCHQWDECSLLCLLSTWCHKSSRTSATSVLHFFNITEAGVFCQQTCACVCIHLAHSLKQPLVYSQSLADGE